MGGVYAAAVGVQRVMEEIGVLVSNEPSNESVSFRIVLLSVVKDRILCRSNSTRRCRRKGTFKIAIIMRASEACPVLFPVFAESL